MERHGENCLVDAGPMDKVVKPDLSIIITSYNRKKFLKAAILSVIDQNLERERYEIIVVKNFVDPEIDEYISANSIISHITGDCNIGEMLRIGIVKSRAPVVTFLDDDDLYETNRLDSILSVFSKNPKLVYYRNEKRDIDEDGFVINNRSDIISKDQVIMFSSYAAMKRVSILGFNMSCIAAQRIILENNLEKISQIESGPDIFLFYLALDCEDAFMAYDTRKLTKYRIHLSSVMHTPNKNEFLRIKRTLELLYRCMPNPKVKTLIASQISRVNILSIIQGEKIDRSTAFEILKFTCKHGITGSKDIIFLLFVITYFIFPSFGKRIFIFGIRLLQKINFQVT